MSAPLVSTQCIYCKDVAVVIFTTDFCLCWQNRLLKLRCPCRDKCRLCEAKVKRGDSCILLLSRPRHPQSPHPNCESWRSFQSYLSFYGVHSAVVVRLDYASAMHPSQNTSRPSVLTQSVSLDISCPIWTRRLRTLSLTHVCHNKLCVLCVVHATAELIQFWKRNVDSGKL